MREQEKGEGGRKKGGERERKGEGRGKSPRKTTWASLLRSKWRASRTLRAMREPGREKGEGWRKNGGEGKESREVGTIISPSTRKAKWTSLLRFKWRASRTPRP
jgi:hypothetical protein